MFVVACNKPDKYAGRDGRVCAALVATLCELKYAINSK